MEHVEDVELQARATRRIFSAVINLAINDACIAPLSGLKGRGNRDGMLRTSLPISRNAFTGMRFLFDETVSGLNEYLMWLDIDPGQYRSRLMDLMWDDSHHTLGNFEPIKRRNFRLNYKMWRDIQRGAITHFDPDNVGEEE